MPSASLRFSKCRLLLALVPVAYLAFPASGQDELVPPSVTGVSAPGAATVDVDGKAQPLEPGATLEGQRVLVADAQSLMIHSRSGRVCLIVIGPAAFTAGIAGETIDIQLESGRIRAAARKSGDTQPVRLVLPGGEGEDPILGAPLGDGVTYAARKGDAFELGFEAAGGAPGMIVQVGGQDSSLGTGQRLTVQGGAAQPATTLDPWRNENGFEQADRSTQLAFASARLSRSIVADKLFSNVIEWDRFASSKEVEATLSAAPQGAEIRTVSAVVASQTPANSPVTGSVNRLSGSFATANQVPPLSPAAIAVGGVSAVTLNNSNAANLLRVTQARGLGFGGLSLLAVAGIDPVTGTRTIGPPGLGARP